MLRWYTTMKLSLWRNETLLVRGWMHASQKKRRSSNATLYRYQNNGIRCDDLNLEKRHISIEFRPEKDNAEGGDRLVILHVRGLV
jgi:hypothetical protein